MNHREFLFELINWLNKKDLILTIAIRCLTVFIFLYAVFSCFVTEESKNTLCNNHNCVEIGEVINNNK